MKATSILCVIFFISGLYYYVKHLDENKGLKCVNDTIITEKNMSEEQKIYSIYNWVKENIEHNCDDNAPRPLLRASSFSVIQGGGCCGDLVRVFICLCSLNDIDAARTYLYRWEDIAEVPGNVSHHVISSVRINDRRVGLDPFLGGIYSLEGNRVLPLDPEFEHTTWWTLRDDTRYEGIFAYMLNWQREPVVLPLIYGRLRDWNVDNIELIRLPSIIEWPYLLSSCLFFSFSFFFFILRVGIKARSRR